jgi:hypothetical protein
MNGLSGYTVGFTLTGEITKDEYDNVIMPAVKEITDHSSTLNMLLVINTDLSNFTVGAWMKDALLGLKNLIKFHRVALVSDSQIVKNITSMANLVVPGEYKNFLMTEESEAKVWVSEK